MSRYELDLLRKLTGLPVSAVRIHRKHRKPRKRCMKPPKMVSRSRVSILIGEDPENAFEVEENEKEVQANPRRKASFLWRGMTLLVRNKCSEGKLRPIYIEHPDGLFKV